MNLEEALAIVDELIKPDVLTTLQEIIIRKCWFNETYQQIANDSDYDANYVRSVGSRLWQKIAEACGEEVTKNNFRSVLRRQSKIEIPNHIDLELPGGTVPLQSYFYVERPPLEQICYQEITQPGAFLRIKAPIKMGKTSLLNRILNAESLDYYRVKLDLQQADSEILSDLNKLIRWLLANICSQLSIKNSVDCYWDRDLGIKVSATVYLENYILNQLDKPLILALDRLHLVFEHAAVAREFLELLSFWSEEAKNSSTWQKLRLIIVQLTENNTLLNSNLAHFSFDVGLSVSLQKFNKQQMMELARRHRLTEKKGFQATEIDYLSDLTGGHPYLARLAFYNLAKHNLNLLQLIEDATTETSIYINLLHYYLAILYRNSALASAFKRVIVAERPVRLETFLASQLASLGLIDLQGNEAVTVCQLYNLYFKDRLSQY